MPPVKRFKKPASKEGKDAPSNKPDLSFTQERFTGPGHKHVHSHTHDDEAEEDEVGEEEELVVSAEDQDNSDVAEATQVLPTWLKLYVIMNSIV